MLSSYRFRKTDLLAVMGLVLLLVWTPGYVASDPLVKDLSEDRTFDLPAPRIGDRLVHEVVVWRAGEGAVTVGPLMVLERRAADAEHCPAHAVMYEHRAYPATNVSFGWSALQIPERNEWVCYDADGRPVWMGKEGEIGVARPYAVDGSRGKIERGRFSMVPPLLSVREEALVHWSGARLVHTSSAVRAGMTELGGELTSFLSRETSRPDLLSKGAAEHRGNLYYEGRRSSEDWILAGFDDGHVEKVGHERHDNLDATLGLAGAYPWPASEPMELRYPDFWAWVSPDWPTPVGEHVAYPDQNGKVVITIDVLPRELTRGTGIAVPIKELRHPYTWSLDKEDHAPAAPLRDGGLRKTTLRALSTDDTVLFRGESLSSLVSSVKGEAPPALRSFVGAGAHLVGFAWTGLPAETASPQGSGPTTVLSHLLPAEIQGPVTTDQTFWTLLFADTTGRMAAAEMEINRTSEGERSVRVADVCSGGALYPGHAYHFVECDPVDPVLIDPDRRIVRPDAWLEALRRDHRELARTAEENGEGFPAQAQLISVVGFEAEGKWALPLRPVHLGMPISGVADHWRAPTSFDGFFVWHQPGPADEVGAERTHHRGTYDLVTGQATYESVTDAGLTPHEPPTQTRPAGVSSSPVQTYDAYASTAAVAGFLLVLASLLVRFGSALKAGAHVAVLAPFFSRISKDSALLHDRRSDMVDLVRAEPGLTAKEIATRFGFAWGVTVHHLGKLVENGLLETVQRGQMRHYFVPGLAKAERLRLAVSRDPRYATFLDAVTSTPGVTLTQLLEAVPQRKAGASRTGSRLADLGLVQKVREGRDVRYYPVTHGASRGTRPVDHGGSAGA